ncbi:MAG: hypothetical protein KF791_05550 [Verrucomicrobiae bacterium]|nr:hypothetical protein [Verrucomicrobiae bacterium]
MNKIQARLESLRRKADQWKQVIESAPAQAERLRVAVNTAAGQFQQLRSEVQGAVAGLRMHDDRHLAAALLEIHEHQAAFLRAGYELAGLDLEPGIAPRLMVHLERLDDVGTSTRRAVLEETRQMPTVHALVSAILKAEEVAAGVRLTGLAYCKLIVQVGPSPTVRIGWRREDFEESASRPGSAPAPAATAPPPVRNEQPTSGFFERSEPAASPGSSSPSATASSEAASVPVPFRPAPQPARSLSPLRVAPIALSTPLRPRPEGDSGGGEARDSLERFKRMPDLTGRG